MSGSPPLPPRVTQEADDRVQGVYQTAGHDVYRASATTQADPRMLPGISAPVRPYQPESLERMPYGFPRPEDQIQRPLSSYASQHSQFIPQHPYLPAPAPIPVSGPMAGYSVTSRPPTQDSQQSFASPKSQRKTKGHVASACVPCKKAHLRCDAQRPCTRCMQNGKEDACVDVQHKKRGRPRLRDDHRGTGFDSRLGHGQDQNIRRPLSLYTPQGPISSGYDDSLRRTQSYRVLKSQPPEPSAPRYLERGSVSGANIYAAPLSISTVPPEPAAFLNMDLEVAKVSSTFADAIGRPIIQGLRITDMLAFGDKERMMALQRQMQDEQARREPNYLPPMYVKQEEEKVFRALGFSREEIASYPLERSDNLRFSDHAGQPRSFSVRLGLAKRGSIYFIVVVLNMNTNTGFRSFQHPTPSPQGRDPRELAYAYPTPQNPYPQSAPVSATFDHGRGRSASDVAYLPRQPLTPSQMVPGLSPRLTSSYAATPNRPDFHVGPPAYQIPRSEMTAAPHSTQAPGYQLPPIRSQQQQQQQQPQYPQQPSYQQAQQAQQQGGPSEQGWSRDDRQRVDIGGLIDRPDPSQRHHG
ncbi:Transcription activator of gluconeogenesis ERT1 [Cytospora mali]|uniref:Transcription activator of gluconeogenesis ERT1 n=1 Tax=Cytospora mali TaxID=578113 RepID=A0A194UU46_CYTMA|nr:Transcription activator of gluconeogenesis ERT1 [Valsa mali var. pyri (nom. inval.)]